MSTRSYGYMMASALFVAVTCLAPVSAASQTWNGPRTPDGQPDIQGIWGAEAAMGNADHSLEDGCCEPEHNRLTNRSAANVGLRKQVIVTPTDGRLPFQPWAEAERRKHLVNMETPTQLQHIEPEDRCALMGVPRSAYRGDIQILQIPGHVVMLYEWGHAYRVIPMDGRPHDPKGLPTWLGDSRGRWEGSTLVVDVTNFRVDPTEYNKQPWFDSHGTFYSDALHVVERYKVVDANTIDYEATMEDPKVFTQPWKLAFQIQRNLEKNREFFEEACWEGNTLNIDVTLSVGRMRVKEGRTGIHSHEEQPR